MSNNIDLKEITRDNLSAVLRLKVRDEQSNQVATNAESIAQGTYADNAWFRAIYSGDMPVGFVMLEIDTEKNEYWIWRYMIDRHHQGKGYGLKALQLVVDFLKTHPGCRDIRLSYVPEGADPPNGFYEKAGFRETGEVIEGERVMKLDIR